MYVKTVPITAFVNPALRQAIKILAAQEGLTVREIITRELERLAAMKLTKDQK